MTSAATIMKGKDLETLNPLLASHPCVYLSACVANFIVYVVAVACLCSHAVSVCGCAYERVCMHARMSEATSER